MPKEIGPREKALREQREARFAENKRLEREYRASGVLLDALRADIAVAKIPAKKPKKKKKVKR